MANFGLTINGSPDSGIGTGLQTLASAFYKTPEQAATIALAKAHILSQEEYRRKLQQDEADAQAEAQRKQTIFDTQTGAADPMAAAARGMVPMPAMPIPVEAGPAAPAYGYTGPPPAVVDPVADARYKTDLATHDRIAAANEAIARAGAYGNDPGKTLYENAGRGVIASAMNDPAIVGGDQQRLASVLATGNLPSETTVLSANDTSGVRAAAGKDIAVEQSKAQIPKVQVVNGVLTRVADAGGAATPVPGAPGPPPFGTAGAGPSRELYSRLLAKQNSGQPLNDLEKAQLQAAASEINKTDTVDASKGGTLYHTDDKGNLVPVPGTGDPNADTGNPYAGLDSLDGKSSAILFHVADLMQKHLPVSQQLALAYGMAIEKASKKTVLYQPPGGGDPIAVTIPQDPPAILPKLEAVQAAAGGAPVAGGGGGPVLNLSNPLSVLPDPVPEPVVPTPAVSAGGGPRVIIGQPLHQLAGIPPVKDSELKNRPLIPQLVQAFAGIRDMPVPDLPGPVMQALAAPQDPGALDNLLEQNAVPPEARRYARFANQFGLMLYQISGAAFPGGELPRDLRNFIPVPADNQAMRMDKLQAAANYVNSLVNVSYYSDANTRHNAQTDILNKYNLQLNDSTFAPDVVDPSQTPAAVTGTPGKGGFDFTQLPPKPSTGVAASMTPAQWAVFWKARPGSFQQEYWKNHQIINPAGQ